jgi:CheY-like chemotaxis protein
LSSQPDQGSTFAFYVKARRAGSRQDFAAIQQRLNADLQSNAKIATNIPKVINDDESAVSKLIPLTGMAGATNSANSSPGSDPSEWHILIVEDNIVNQKVLAMQIRKLGCVVYIANHGGEALDLIKETKHYKGREEDGKELSIVLMDLEMPVMDGLTCVRKIREMEAEGLIHGHLLIIAVTANARGEQIANAKDSGMDDVMPKPFRILQIRSKIEALLNSKAMTTE